MFLSVTDLVVVGLFVTGNLVGVAPRVDLVTMALVGMTRKVEVVVFGVLTSLSLVICGIETVMLISGLSFST